jgi:penicillin amidase
VVLRLLGKILGGLLVFVLVLAMAASAFAWYTIRKSFPQTEGQIQVTTLQADVEVIRDVRGVPNIYADSVSDLYTALGYVHAQDRFYEMDVRRHITSGRLSEMFGETQVQTDAFLRTLGWREVAQRELAILSPDSRRILASYARGVNQYLNGKSSADVSLEYLALGLENPEYQIEEWDPVDSVAWLKALAWDLRGNMDQEISRVLTATNVGIPRTEELFPPYPYERVGTIVGDAQQAEAVTGRAQAKAVVSQASATAFRDVQESVSLLSDVLGPVGEGVGSDSWVADGSLTDTGLPILANDPHLGPAMPSLWYQAGLHCRPGSSCAYDVSGWTMSGLPGVFIGHNADISWGFTNLGPDVTDLVLEKTKGDKYFVDGQLRDMLSHQETIKVAGGSPVEVTVRATGAGPILSDVVADGGKTYREVGEQAPVPAPGQAVAATKQPRGAGYAVALKWTALTPRPTFDAMDLIAKANDWDTFRAAAEFMAVPSQNLIYADTKGNIGYQAPGAIPIRKNYNGKWPVPGWDSRFSWTGMIPFEQLPSIKNPPQHWITTANQTVVPKDDPVQLQADVYSYGARAVRINTRIDQILAAGGKLTKQDMAQIQMDAGNELAEFIVPRIQGLQLSPSGTSARALFADWDFQQPADSAAGAYFNVFYKNLVDRMFNDEVSNDQNTGANAGDQYWEVIRVLWSKPKNRWWDDAATEQVEGRNQTVAAALNAAADQLVADQGQNPQSWSWGQLHTLTVENQTLGQSDINAVRAIFNRGPIQTGGGGSIPLATGWQPSQGYEVTWLPSMRQVVDMANLDASTWVNLTGNSGHAFNPNYVDQLDAWATGEQYPWPFGRTAVLQAGVETLTLTPNSVE